MDALQILYKNKSRRKEKKNRLNSCGKDLENWRQKTDEKNMEEINAVKNKNADDAEENYNTLKTMLNSMEVKEGGLDPNQIWT